MLQHELSSVVGLRHSGKLHGNCSGQEQLVQPKGWQKAGWGLHQLGRCTVILPPWDAFDRRQSRPNCAGGKNCAVLLGENPVRQTKDPARELENSEENSSAEKQGPRHLDGISIGKTGLARKMVVWKNHCELWLSDLRWSSHATMLHQHLAPQAHSPLASGGFMQSQLLSMKSSDAMPSIIFQLRSIWKSSQRFARRRRQDIDTCGHSRSCLSQIFLSVAWIRSDQNLLFPTQKKT